VEIFGPRPDFPTSRRAKRIDVADYRAMRFVNSPWACTLEKDSGASRYDLTLGLEVRKAVTLGAAVIGNVPVWQVSAAITGPQHETGTADYYIAQSSFTLRRLVMVTVVGSARQPAAGIKGTVDYSHWGERVVTHLPKSCHYLGITSAELAAFTIEGQAMEPNFHNGQSVWVDTQSYRHHPPKRGDVIVFRAVPAAQPGRDFVKRIVGLPGETIAIHNNTVYINHRPLHETYRRRPMSYTFPSLKIPPNDYFVLGDNRDNSEDSHLWRWLPGNDIIGKVVLS
jgi:signal peptidase I